MRKLLTGDVFSILEQWAPKTLAYDWDPIGLQVGSYKEPVEKIMVALDVDERVVGEAIEHGVNLIIAHHPLLFQSLHSIDVQSPKGAVIQSLIKHNITVYAAHTNLDIADGGVNDMLADRLGVEETEVLVQTEEEPLFKFVVFVPNNYANRVQQAIGVAGAGYIGNYRDCSFNIRGEGSFKPLKDAQPFIGTIDERKQVEETRIETIVQQSRVQQVVDAAKNAHPYEEVAYDLYVTNNPGKQYGLGRIGKWSSEKTVPEVIQQVKETFELTHVRFIGDDQKSIRTVAIVGGSGEKFITAAKEKGADIYITGDITYHAAQEAEYIGLSVIDAGHYIEHVMIQETTQFLNNHLETSGIKCMESSVTTDPFSYR